jgi:hypothetical protein
VEAGDLVVEIPGHDGDQDLVTGRVLGADAEAIDASMGTGARYWLRIAGVTAVAPSSRAT